LRAFLGQSLPGKGGDEDAGRCRGEDDAGLDRAEPALGLQEDRCARERCSPSGSGWGPYVQSGEFVTGRSITGQQYGRFLIEVFQEWVRRDVGEAFVQMFDVALANWYGEPPSLCVHSETCGLALALEHNGDLYSCDHFVEPEYKLGNIAQTPMLELVVSPRQQAFGQAKRDTLPAQCRECDMRFACHGGCPKDRFIHNDTNATTCHEPSCERA
jgi:uncharacterized protein